MATGQKFSACGVVNPYAAYDTLCDVIGNGTHVGSTAVRDFLLDAQPGVCLCGHIHESRAVDRLGRTVLVNTGAFAMGGYAELRLAGDDLTVTLHVLGE